jgi:4-hydroxy-4-methyl-2-oxoglutarate aldolase
VKTHTLDPAQLDELRLLDSCSIANAIETFDVRLRNRGFTESGIHCVFDDFPPMVGYAATARVRTTEPPMEGHSYYYRLDWLDHVLSVPPPRILILEDMDRHPGLGSFVGDVHANILMAAGCVGLVTNGAVRNVPEARKIQFQMYAGNRSVSHAYAHIYEFGKPVKIGQLEIEPGDLLHGDRHGVQTIPSEIADRVAGVARKMTEQEGEVIQLCQSGNFTVERLRAEVGALSQKRRDLQR